VLALFAWASVTFPLTALTATEAGLQQQVEADWRAQEQRLGREPGQAAAIRAALERGRKLLASLRAHVPLSEPALTPSLSRPTGDGAPATAGEGEGWCLVLGHGRHPEVARDQFLVLGRRFPCRCSQESQPQVIAGADHFEVAVGLGPDTHAVEARPVRAQQFVLEPRRGFLGGAYLPRDGVHRVKQPDSLAGGMGQRPVRAQALPQIARLAHIQQRAIRAEHPIDAGPAGKLTEELGAEASLDWPGGGDQTQLAG